MESFVTLDFDTQKEGWAKNVKFNWSKRAEHVTKKLYRYFKLCKDGVTLDYLYFWVSRYESAILWLPFQSWEIIIGWPFLNWPPLSLGLNWRSDQNKIKPKRCSSFLSASFVWIFWKDNTWSAFEICVWIEYKIKIWKEKHSDESRLRYKWLWFDALYVFQDIPLTHSGLRHKSSHARIDMKQRGRYVTVSYDGLFPLLPCNVR